MKELQIFQNENFGEVRTITINEEIWFVGKDIANALGYENTKDALIKHVDKEDKQIIQRSQFATLEIPNRGMTIINESGLYSLVLSSKLSTAKLFKRWITSEVLPTLRKTGSYTVPKSPMQLLELEFQAIREIDSKVEVIKKDLEDFKDDMPLLALEIERITKARNRTAVRILCGKESNAYKNKSIRGKVYSDMSKEIERQFGVNTYKAIKRKDCDKVIALIENYYPPMCLEDEILTENSQITIPC